MRKIMQGIKKAQSSMHDAVIGFYDFKDFFLNTRVLLNKAMEESAGEPGADYYRKKIEMILNEIDKIIRSKKSLSEFEKDIVRISTMLKGLN